MDTNRLETYFFLALLVLVLVLTVFILLPHLSALMLAAVFAVVMRPTYRRFSRLFRGREGTAALATVLVVLIIIFTPLMVLGVKIFQEITNMYLALLDNGPDFGGVLARLESYLQRAVPGISVSLGEYLRQFISWLLKNISFIFTGLTQVALAIFLGLLGLYYLLKDGEKFESRLVSLLPLSPRYSQLILERLTATINSVIKGSLLIALVQGFLTGVGFWVFGVPNPAFWGSVTVFAALVPAVGTSLVIVPGVAYLFLTAKPLAAFGLLAWGMLAVGFIDNFLAPQFIKRGARIHPFLILLSVLGGLSLMGPIGFLAGPLVLSVLFALFDIYAVLILKREIAK